MRQDTDASYTMRFHSFVPPKVCHFRPLERYGVSLAENASAMTDRGQSTL